MGGFDYNIGSQYSGYGRETPRETNYIQLSPLLCCRPCTFLPEGSFGSSIGFLSRVFRKVIISFKLLILKVVSGIKKTIA
tara:strand:- start:83 stop:322 length:240 start_codon:yes stop_codon:yes gene_type:complete